MKIGPYTLPDACPDDCRFQGDPQALSQGGMCYRCPIMNCTPFDFEGEPLTLVEVTDFRLDWAQEWEEFFRSGKIPELRLERKETD